MDGERVLCEKNVRARCDAKVAAPVSDIDIGPVRYDNGAFADPRPGLAGGFREWRFQAVLEAATALFDTQVIGYDVEMIETVI